MAGGCILESLYTYTPGGKFCLPGGKFCLPVSKFYCGYKTNDQYMSIYLSIHSYLCIYIHMCIYVYCFQQNSTFAPDFMFC